MILSLSCALFGIKWRMRVTFDTKPLDAVISPETAQHPIDPAHAATVREALGSGLIAGFFSEGLASIEGIENKDRADVLGSTRLVSQFESSDPREITLNLGMTYRRNPLNERFYERIRAARLLGMHALPGAARVGKLRHQVEGDDLFFMPYDSVAERLACMEKANTLDAAIGKRGVGRAQAQLLGLSFSKRDGVLHPELWQQGLGRAREGELKAVTKAVAEWADGEIVAAHYGHGIDFLCCEDFNKNNSSGPSIFDCVNRAWLTEEFGVRFVTVAQLAGLVAA
jgi:hypothetical protein